MIEGRLTHIPPCWVRTGWQSVSYMTDANIMLNNCYVVMLAHFWSERYIIYDIIAIAELLPLL